MEKGFIPFLFILAAVCWPGLENYADAQPLERGVSIFVRSTPGENPDPAKTLSVKHMVQVAGLPFVVTQNVEEATSQAIIITTDGFDGDNLTDSERQKLANYVSEGGVLISPNFKDEGLFDVFGISGETFATNRYSYTYNTSMLANLFKWIDEPREQTIPLGDPNKDRAINSRSYATDQAEVLARFDDGSPAVIRNRYGDGFAYAFGISFRDVIVRYQLGYDMSANRSYSNSFEPASDTFGLVLRGLAIEHIPYTVWKHTAPFNSSSVLIITHDIDAESNMEWMNRFSALEESMGIQATYNITTHYINDYLDGDYYTPYRKSISQLAEQNQEVGSHSVGHFPDFGELPIGTLGETHSSYSPYYDDGKSHNATLLGELEVSKKLLINDTGQPVNTFRSGHLIFHDKLINALDSLGYKFDSSFTSNNVLNSFPYRSLTDRSFSGRISGVWEIPLTLTDVIDEEFTEDNIEEVVSMWLEVAEKYDANSAPTVLLIHPNRELKLKAEERFIELLPPEMSYGTITSYGNYWKQRNRVEFRSELQDGALEIHLENMNVLPDSISLKISDGESLNKVMVYGKDGTVQAYASESTGDNDLLLYKIMTGSGNKTRELSIKEPVKVYPNYPNPFERRTTITYDLKETSHVTLEIYDILGRKVETLVDQNQQSGPHWIEFDADGISSGMYLYKLSVNSYTRVGQLILVK